MVAPISNTAVGSPDFGQNPSGNPSAPGYDIGELGNRILLGGGSMSRSGRWFFTTGFEGGPPLVEMVGSGDLAPTIGGAQGTWQGNNCLIMTTPALATQTSTATKTFLSQFAPGKWGIEAMIAVANQNTDFYITLANRNRTAPFLCTIRLHFPALASGITVDYLDSAAAFQNIVAPGADFAVAVNNFHNVKLVMDFTLNQYVKFILDGVTYPLTGISGYSNGVPDTNIRQYFLFSNVAAAAAASTVLVDNVILSADEP